MLKERRMWNEVFVQINQTSLQGGKTEREALAKATIIGVVGKIQELPIPLTIAIGVKCISRSVGEKLGQTPDLLGAVAVPT